MKTGERWSSWKPWLAALLALLPTLLSAPGCAKDRASVEKNLLAQQKVQFQAEVAGRYRLGCPDIVELVVPARPEFNGRYPVQPDGRIDLGNYGTLRIE